mgnify:CR=1 FL=1
MSGNVEIHFDGYEKMVSSKLIGESIILRKDYFEKFLNDVGADYKGPFRKSCRLTHRDLINVAKKHGVPLYRGRDGWYYIDEQTKINIKPILFNPELLDRDKKIEEIEASDQEE